ncbi:MAG: NifB/NifX family molybdenum-iron cluster-binding protein [Gemmatimonadales bacterium]|jgi:predicted Fe-Mo cluster-binding NifX family protein
MTKIALTVASPGLDAELDPRFGRATFLLLVDPETLAYEGLANPGREAPGGAAVEAAQFLADHAAAAVISGDFGPKAQRALDAAGIAMYRFESCVTAREALERFKARELPAAGAGLRLEDGEG